MKRVFIIFPANSEKILPGVIIEGQIEFMVPFIFKSQIQICFIYNIINPFHSILVSEYKYKLCRHTRTSQFCKVALYLLVFFNNIPIKILILW